MLYVALPFSFFTLHHGNFRNFLSNSLYNVWKENILASKFRCNQKICNVFGWIFNSIIKASAAISSPNIIPVRSECAFLNFNIIVGRNTNVNHRKLLVKFENFWFLIRGCFSITAHIQWSKKVLHHTYTCPIAYKLFQTKKKHWTEHQKVFVQY